MSPTREWGNKVCDAWHNQYPGKWLIVGKGGDQDGWGKVLDPKGGRDYECRLEDLDEEEVFDFVLMAWTLSYLDDPIWALRRAKHALVCGGHVGIITRMHGWDDVQGGSKINKWVPTRMLMELHLPRILEMEKVEFEYNPKIGAPTSALLLRR
jgi:hypothetical protein